MLPQTAITEIKSSQFTHTGLTKEGKSSSYSASDNTLAKKKQITSNEISSQEYAKLLEQSQITFEKQRKVIEEQSKILVEQRKERKEDIKYLIGWIVALLSAIFAGYQAYISRNTAKKQLRAYVYVEIRRINEIIDEGPRKIHLTIKNFGQTPAKLVKHKVWAQILDYPLNKDLIFEDDRITGVFEVPPGSHLTHSPKISSFTDFDRDEIINKRKAIYIWGRITYKDIDRVSHFTKYSFIQRGPWAIEGVGLCNTTHDNESN